MQPEKNYLNRGWIALTMLIAVLVGVSFIPPQSVGGIHLRRANILSDLLTFEDAAETKAEPALFDEEEFHVDMEQVAERIVADSLADSVRTTFEWSRTARLDPPRPASRHGAPHTAHRPHRGLRHDGHEPHAAILRGAARRPAGAHRRSGRLLHRGRHPDGRPARTAPVRLWRRRYGFRPDGLAADGLPPHGAHAGPRLELLQHHAAAAHARGAARQLLRLGMGLQPRRGGLDALGGDRRPTATRLGDDGPRTLPRAGGCPHRGDAQRHAEPQLRRRG